MLADGVRGQRERAGRAAAEHCPGPRSHMKSGFTAISSPGPLRFGRDGRWYAGEEAIPNAAICRLFSRSLTVLPDGRGRLELGEDQADVLIEDTPWVVTGVDGDPVTGFGLVLNDDTREPLDPTSLEVGPAHVLYARVKGGAHRARFLRPAYYALVRHAEPGPDGSIVLPVGDHRVPIGAAGA